MQKNLLLLLLSILCLGSEIEAQVLTLDDGGPETAVGDDLRSGVFLWLNRFTPPPGDYPLKVTDVQVQFPATPSLLNQNIDVYVWEDTDLDGNPGTGAVLLGSASGTITAADNSTFVVLPITTTQATTVGDILVGVINRDGPAPPNHEFPANLDQTATQGRSWGGTWNLPGPTDPPILPAPQDWGTIDSFGLAGNWMVRASYMANLPVELTNFEALVEGNDVILAWDTASEENNSGFFVQSKSFGSEYTNHGFIDGHGSTLEAQSYDFRVENLSAGVHTFRLQQLDFDGLMNFSDEIEVTVELPGPASISSAYPNPFSSSSSFSLIVAEDQEVRVELFDALGRNVQTIFNSSLTANQRELITIEGSSLKNGLYFYQVNGQNFKESGRLVLQK